MIGKFMKEFVAELRLLSNYWVERLTGNTTEGRMRRLELEISLEYERPEAYSGSEGLRKFQAVQARTQEKRVLLASLSTIVLRGKLDQAGIAVPKQYLMEDSLQQIVLTDDGVMWARRELRLNNRQAIEFWAKLIVPLISLAVSIVALVFAIRNR